MNMVRGSTRKRKAPEEDPHVPLDDLNQDLLERVLSWLPASCFLRLRSVCKRWSSVAASATFRIACSQIPSRDPWFLMVDQELDRRPIVFDSSQGNWKHINHPIHLRHGHGCKLIPVSSARGFICYRTASGGLIISNPVTGACRQLPPTHQAAETRDLHAISMCSSPMNPSAYRVVLVMGEFPNLSVAAFDSSTNMWEGMALSAQKVENSDGSLMAGDETVYFLSKDGDVVATNMQRSPSKQYSSAVSIENGEEVVYFLSPSGTVVACNLVGRTFFELPRLLPVYLEYSMDVVECRGEMLVVVLSEFLETASMRVWSFSGKDRSWRQAAAMPPSMSHAFYGKKADINCVGHGSTIFICISCREFSCCVVCNLEIDQWVELPRCYVDGEAREFLSAFSFEPRLEAVV